MLAKKYFHKILAKKLMFKTEDNVIAGRLEEKKYIKKVRYFFAS
jgi:hypothetical protein